MIANITTTYCETYIIVTDIHCEELFTVIKNTKKGRFQLYSFISFRQYVKKGRS